MIIRFAKAGWINHAGITNNLQSQLEALYFIEGFGYLQTWH
ncbi:hypothetical protein [Paenibacillus phytorum]|nr:hypothetical protein [Paenibacillus phytorum]